jgi:hypothetical protein
MNKITTSERLENSIRHQPERYDVVREKDELKSVFDNDTGRIWIKTNICWVWID